MLDKRCTSYYTPATTIRSAEDFQRNIPATFNYSIIAIEAALAFFVTLIDRISRVENLES